MTSVCYHRAFSAKFNLVTALVSFWISKSRISLVLLLSLVKTGTRNDQQVGEKSGQSKGFPNSAVKNSESATGVTFIKDPFAGTHKKKNNKNMDEDLKKMLALVDIHDLKYTQCTVKLRPYFEKIAQLKCTTNEKRNC